MAHVSGLPVEELLPTLLGGGGAWVILGLTSLGTQRLGRGAARRADDSGPGQEQPARG